MDLRLQDIAEVQIGYQPRGQVAPGADGSHWLLQGRDLDFIGGKGDSCADPALWTIRNEQLDRIKPKGDALAYRVGVGDVLFLSRGPHPVAIPLSRHLLGDRADGGDMLIAAYTFYIVRPTGVVLPEYLAWFINQPPSQAYLQAHLRGSAAKLLPKSALDEMPVIVPPSSRQHQIVEIDNLRARENSLMTRLASARRRLVQAACLAAIDSTSTDDKQA